MRETKINKGLHKARANCFANGMVPVERQVAPTSFRGIGRAIASGYNSTDRKFNRMRPSMARVLGLETRSAKEG